MNVRPAAMAAYAPVHHGDHMRVIQMLLPAELSKICDVVDLKTVWVDESIVCFDVVALSHTIAVCPSFIRLQLAFALGQTMHQGKV